MISKSKIKLINSLSQKKFRDETAFFIAEGTKLIIDLAGAFECEILIATPEWIALHPDLKSNELIEATEDDFKKISNQKSSQGVFAVFKQNSYNWTKESLSNKLTLALDDIQDPGNLGTILRIADWFGITDVFCSEHTADAYNPKTVQATMGALARVRVHTVNLKDFITECKGSLPVYGTFMDGDNIYEKELKAEGIIVMGNEGNGISQDIEALVSDKLLIPNFPVGIASSESLNVGVATALVCGEFRRRI